MRRIDPNQVKKGSLIIGEGIFVGFGGFIGGYIGGYVTHYISDIILQFLFLGLLIFALFRLFFSKHNEDDEKTKTLNKALLFSRQFSGNIQNMGFAFFLIQHNLVDAHSS